MRILIATAVDNEREAVMKGMKKRSHVDVVTVGVGPVEAAIHTTMKLANHLYDFVINMGIAGGFGEHVEIGSLVVADEVIHADLGAETQNHFLPFDQLGLGLTSIKGSHSYLTVANAFRSAGIPTHTGPILTVSTATGTKETASELATRTPGALAEAMEGFGIASAAKAYEIPFLEIRAISNVVGPRERDKWHINESLKTLTNASYVLEKEVLHANCLLSLSQ